MCDRSKHWIASPSEQTPCQCDSSKYFTQTSDSKSCRACINSEENPHMRVYDPRRDECVCNAAIGYYRDPKADGHCAYGEEVTVTVSALQFQPCDSGRMYFDYERMECVPFPTQQLQVRGVHRRAKEDSSTGNSGSSLTYKLLGSDREITVARQSSEELKKNVYQNVYSISARMIPNGLSRHPAILKLGLHNIVELKVESNNLTHLKSGFFDGLVNLKTLTITHTLISTVVSPDVFYGLDKLKELNLEDNQIANVGESVFDSLAKLEILRLENNKIKHLNARMFCPINKLRKLYVDENVRMCLPSSLFNEHNFEIFSGVGEGRIVPSRILDHRYKCNDDEQCGTTKVRDCMYHGKDYLVFGPDMRCSSAGISFDSDGSDSNIGKATFMTIRNGKPFETTSLDMKTFLWGYSRDNSVITDWTGKRRRLRDFNALLLRQGKLHNLGVDYFRGLEHLEYLYVYDCSVRSIENGAFELLIDLKELSMTGNDITILDTSIFEGLNKLEDLDLSSNRIKTIKGFFNLPSLVSLNLASNLIEELPAGVFAEVQELSYLSLKSNKIKKFPRELFTDNALLEVVDLSKNANGLLDKVFMGSKSTPRTIIVNEFSIVCLPKAMVENEVRVLPPQTSVGCFEGGCSVAGLESINQICTQPETTETNSLQLCDKNDDCSAKSSESGYRGKCVKGMCICPLYRTGLLCEFPTSIVTFVAHGVKSVIVNVPLYPFSVRHYTSQLATHVEMVSPYLTSEHVNNKLLGGLGLLRHFVYDIPVPYGNTPPSVTPDKVFYAEHPYISFGNFERKVLGINRRSDSLVAGTRNEMHFESNIEGANSLPRQRRFFGWYMSGRESFCNRVREAVAGVIQSALISETGDTSTIHEYDSHIGDYNKNLQKLRFFVEKYMEGDGDCGLEESEHKMRLGFQIEGNFFEEGVGMVFDTTTREAEILNIGDLKARIVFVKAKTVPFLSALGRCESLYDIDIVIDESGHEHWPSLPVFCGRNVVFRAPSLFGIAPVHYHYQYSVYLSLQYRLKNNANHIELLFDYGTQYRAKTGYRWPEGICEPQNIYHIGRRREENDIRCFRCGGDDSCEYVTFELMDDSLQRIDAVQPMYNPEMNVLSDKLIAMTSIKSPAGEVAATSCDLIGKMLRAAHALATDMSLDASGMISASLKVSGCECLRWLAFDMCAPQTLGKYHSLAQFHIASTTPNTQLSCNFRGLDLNCLSALSSLKINIRSSQTSYLKLHSSFLARDVPLREEEMNHIPEHFVLVGTSSLVMAPYFQRYHIQDKKSVCEKLSVKSKQCLDKYDCFECIVYGEMCGQPACPGINFPCSKHGKCTVSGCKCDPGFYGVDCGSSVCAQVGAGSTNIDSQSLVVCKPHEVCNTIVGRCECVVLTDSPDGSKSCVREEDGVKVKVELKWEVTSHQKIAEHVFNGIFALEPYMLLGRAVNEDGKEVQVPNLDLVTSVTVSHENDNDLPIKHLPPHLFSGLLKVLILDISKLRFQEQLQPLTLFGTLYRIALFVPPKELSFCYTKHDRYVLQIGSLEADNHRMIALNPNAIDCASVASMNHDCCSRYWLGVPTGMQLGQSFRMEYDNSLRLSQLQQSNNNFYVSNNIEADSSPRKDVIENYRSKNVAWSFKEFVIHTSSKVKEGASGEAIRTVSGGKVATKQGFRYGSFKIKALFPRAHSAVAVINLWRDPQRESVAWPCGGSIELLRLEFVDGHWDGTSSLNYVSPRPCNTSNAQYEVFNYDRSFFLKPESLGLLDAEKSRSAHKCTVAGLSGWLFESVLELDINLNWTPFGIEAWFSDDGLETESHLYVTSNFQVPIPSIEHKLNFALNIKQSNSLNTQSDEELETAFTISSISYAPPCQSVQVFVISPADELCATSNLEAFAKSHSVIDDQFNSEIEIIVGSSFDDLPIGNAMCSVIFESDSVEDEKSFSRYFEGREAILPYVQFSNNGKESCIDAKDLRRGFRKIGMVYSDDCIISNPEQCLMHEEAQELCFMQHVDVADTSGDGAITSFTSAGVQAASVPERVQLSSGNGFWNLPVVMNSDNTVLLTDMCGMDFRMGQEGGSGSISMKIKISRESVDDMIKYDSTLKVESAMAGYANYHRDNTKLDSPFAFLKSGEQLVASMHFALEDESSYDITMYTGVVV